jgi:hypothetical protein
MDLGLQGKVAIVTGSSDGIGYAPAMPWREKGCVLSYTFCEIKKNVIRRRTCSTRLNS